MMSCTGGGTEAATDYLENDSSYLYIAKDTCGVDSVTAESDTTKQSRVTGHYNGYHSNSYESVDESGADPEYRKDGKYDPELYHTDYAGQEERRQYIDNDGYDDNYGYDEYYGFRD